MSARQRDHPDAPQRPASPKCTLPSRPPGDPRGATPRTGPGSAPAATPRMMCAARSRCRMHSRSSGSHRERRPGGHRLLPEAVVERARRPSPGGTAFIARSSSPRISSIARSSQIAVLQREALGLAGGRRAWHDRRNSPRRVPGGAVYLNALPSQSGGRVGITVRPRLQRPLAGVSGSAPRTGCTSDLTPLAGRRCLVPGSEPRPLPFGHMEGAWLAAHALAPARRLAVPRRSSIAIVSRRDSSATWLPPAGETQTIWLPPRSLGCLAEPARDRAPAPGPGLGAADQPPAAPISRESSPATTPARSPSRCVIGVAAARRPARTAPRSSPTARRDERRDRTRAQACIGDPRPGRVPPQPSAFVSTYAIEAGQHLPGLRAECLRTADLLRGRQDEDAVREQRHVRRVRNQCRVGGKLVDT